MLIAAVGTNGVGKTTALAKLASNLLMCARENGKRDPRIQFITIDSVRVGAFEQLERFARIFNTDAHKVETAEELQKAYNDRQDKTDALFIDTSGCNPNDTEHINKISSILQARGFEADIYLFDESEGWYRDEIASTALAASKSGVTAKINISGIVHAAMDDVYPSSEFPSLLRAAGVKTVLDSDAHRASDIAFGFDRESETLLLIVF